MLAQNPAQPAQLQTSQDLQRRGCGQETRTKALNVLKVSSRLCFVAGLDQAKPVDLPESEFLQEADAFTRCSKEPPHDPARQSDEGRLRDVSPPRESRAPAPPPG
ncbi:MAG: hypothetical protein ACREYA_19055, partial [Cupriavidus necator]